MMQTEVDGRIAAQSIQTKTLTVLNVAYPLAPVSPDSAGGAEQVLVLLDEALTTRGHRSLVVAPQGSQVAGELFPIPYISGPFDDTARHDAWEHQRTAIQTALSTTHIDLVHMHGVDFYEYLPPPGVPVLVTLHLPPDWYPSRVFRLDRPATFLHCVSVSQARACPPRPNLLGVIDNGIQVRRFATAYRKSD